MARSVKLLTPVFTLVALLAIAEYHAIRIGHYTLISSKDEPRFGWLVGLLALMLIISYAMGVSERGLSVGSRFTRSAGAVGRAIAIIALAQLFLQVRQQIPRFDLIMTFVVIVPGLAFVAAWGDRRLTAGEGGQQERVIALVGADDHERLVRDIERAPERRSQLVASLRPEEPLPTPEHPTPLVDLIKQHRPTLIVLNREAFALDELVAQTAEAHSQGLRIRTLSLFYDEWLGKLPISELERIALLFDISELHRPVYARIKRFIDVAVAMVGLLVMVIVVPFVLLADLGGNRGSLFYSQPRVGKNGAEFTIHKFRTMRASTAPTAWTETNDPRLGRVGRMLRKLHVDELPQFWNVLRRDMSVVGPRPEQPHYVAQLRESIPFYDIRHLVRPGITGWAQVKYDYGATELDALEKLQYEFYYLRHQDLTLDLRIIGRTLRSMLGGEGR